MVRGRISFARWAKRWETVVEHGFLTTDVARAGRSSAAMMVVWLACVASGHGVAAVVAAPAAQNVAMLQRVSTGRF